MEEINLPWKISIISSRGQAQCPGVEEEKFETPKFCQNEEYVLIVAKNWTISNIIKIEGPNGIIWDDKEIRKRLGI